MQHHRRHVRHVGSPTDNAYGSGTPAWTRLLGIPEDDPGYDHIARFIYREARDGTDFDDPAERQRIIESARLAAAFERARAAEELTRESKCWVYYLRVGRYVKIGTAIDVRARLGAYPPDAQLLAVEQGYLRKEAERLAEFAEYLSARREWFTPGPRLMAHIAAIHNPGQLARCVAPPDGDR
jgi:hypothetical protein